jgi:hypothetical protein
MRDRPRKVEATVIFLRFVIARIIATGDAEGNYETRPRFSAAEDAREAVQLLR